MVPLILEKTSFNDFTFWKPLPVQWYCIVMVDYVRGGGKGYHSGEAIIQQKDSWVSGGYTLPETNMETQKRPCKDYSPSKRGLHGFPC